MQEREEATQAIVDAVRARGDAAVAEFTERFDKVALRPDEFEVSQDEIDAAMTSVDSGLLDALRRAHANIKAFHEKNLRQSWEERSDDGTVMGQRVSPVASAGVYVPGGTAFYPSSVLMNIAPARVAGVDEIVMVSPPSYNGTILPLVLAAARIAGATRVFRVGGAQAVAALAYGTDTIPAVMKITGPGNMFVMLAKRFVSSFCAIDTEAGPSEVVVMVDDSTDPARAAAELLAQAEHDVDAVAILVSTSRTKVDEVMAAVKAETANLSRADIIRQALADFGEAFVVRDAAEASRLTNTIAPEHLSIQTEDSMATFDTISNAGAVMIGGETPVAVTDYYAGPNHILPTGRRARFSSPLTTEDFRKVTNFVSYSAERLKRDADDIMRLATEEKLTAHARAVEVRL
ncbi:MAG: histidinol dehydrogenase [bacterium]|nr:histidinol dehydrogenase [bacterium]